MNLIKIKTSLYLSIVERIENERSTPKGKLKKIAKRREKNQARNIRRRLQTTFTRISTDVSSSLGDEIEVFICLRKENIY